MSRAPASFNEAVVRGRRRARRPRCSGAGARCFNEAVVRGRRRASGRQARRPATGPLQRSRRPRTTERAEKDRRIDAVLLASTKPSSEDDGEDHNFPIIRSRGGVLQRSRRPRTTESPPVPEDDRLHRDASTKPSSEDDGEPAPPAPRRARNGPLQRSRRPRTTESCPPTWRFACWPRGFNEAVVRGRRRAASWPVLF